MKKSAKKKVTPPVPATPVQHVQVLGQFGHSGQIKYHPIPRFGGGCTKC